MSLIHWWPLNGDTQDKIGNIKLTGTFTSNVSGKIGSCAQQNSARLTASTTSLTNLKSFSVAMWVKFSSTASTAWCDLFGFMMKKGTTTDSMRAEVTSNGGSSFSVFCNSISGSSGGYANFSLSKNVWTHLVFIKDGGTVSTYKNGVLSGTNTLANFVDAYATGEFHIGDSNFYSAYNDVRIFDHVLSQAEVKELSKALVVHYTFDDVLAEPTINYSNPSQWSIYSAYWTLVTNTDSGFKIKKTSGNTETTVAFSNGVIYEQMSVGEIWTTTCYLYKNGQPYKSSTNALTNYGLGISVLNFESRDDGYYSSTFKINSKSNAYLIHARIFGNTVSESDIYEIKFLQFEKKDHATPYTPTSRESMLRNEAETIQPTTVSNIMLTNDSASGSYSLKCAGSTYLNHTPLGDASTGATASMWIKDMDTTGQIVVFADANSQLAFGPYGSYCCIGCVNGTNKRRASNVSSLWKADEWNHVVIRKDSNNTFYCYINGVETTYGATDYWTHSTYLTIGARYSSGYSRQFTGLIDDFRLYYTCLTEDEIQDLYRARALITDKGDVETHQFVEDCSNLQVTNNHCVEARDIQEIGNEEYEQLEYIASTGTQYIDTGVYWTSEKATIVADLMVTAWKASSTIFGSEEGYTSPYSSSKRYFAHILHAGSTNGNYATYTGTGSIGTTTLTKDTRSVIEYITHGNNKVTTRVTVNGTTTTCVNNQVYSGTILNHQNSKQTAENRGHIYIFSNHNAASGTAGIQNMSAMRLYRFTMIQDDIYLRDFIPCRRKSDSKVGLFDLVTGQFYTSPVGNFTAGNVVTNEDITAKFLSGGSIQARQFIEI